MQQLVRCSAQGCAFLPPLSSTPPSSQQHTAPSCTLPTHTQLTHPTHTQAHGMPGHHAIMTEHNEERWRAIRKGIAPAYSMTAIRYLIAGCGVKGGGGVQALTWFDAAA